MVTLGYKWLHMVIMVYIGLHMVILRYTWLQWVINGNSWLNVTEFAKRGLIHASDFSTLRRCNSASVGPTAMKFDRGTLLS